MQKTRAARTLQRLGTNRSIMVRTSVCGRGLELVVSIPLAKLAITGVLPLLAAAQTPTDLFSTTILPVLERDCQGCHGATQAISKLDLRTRAALLAGAGTGHFDLVATAQAWAHTAAAIAPDLSRHAAYQPLLLRLRQAYSQNFPLWHPSTPSP